MWKKKNQLAKHPNVNGFVFLTAKNYCLDQLKKKKVIPIEDKYIEIEAEKHHPEINEVDNSKFEKIQIIINQLPEQQREVILLRDFDGLEFEEISEMTGYTYEHLRVILSRARKNVRTQYQNKYSYEKERTR